MVPPCLLGHSLFFWIFINVVIYNHRNNPIAISGTSFPSPTHIHPPGPRPAGDRRKLSPSPPEGGPQPVRLLFCWSSRSQSLQLLCTRPPLRERKHYGGPEERRGRKPITAEGCSHPARPRGGVIGQDGQPREPIELLETGEGADARRSQNG